MAKRRFEMKEGTSAKFWEVECVGSELIVCFGRVGTDGQCKKKDLGTAAAAQKEQDKLIKEKTGKGYIEQKSTAVSAKKTPSVPAGDVLAALRAEGQALLDGYGELTLLEEGGAPEIENSFVAGVDGELWKRVFDDIVWLAEEADGGAVGWWNRVSPAAIVYADNEGSFTLTGFSLIDHFAWRDYEGEYTKKLEAFCKKFSLPLPMEEKARKAALAKLETPEGRFAELQKELKKAAEKPKKKSDEKKSTAKSAKVEKTPRPFARNLKTCVLDDGRLLVVTGEDFGKSYEQIITKGATFVFDPATLRFTTHEICPSEKPYFYVPPPLVPLDGGRALMLGTGRVWSDGKWSDARSDVPGLGFEMPFAPRLSDGSHLLFGANGSMFRVVGERFEPMGALPERREWDSVVPLADGRYWLGAGEAQEGQYISCTDRTVYLDSKTWTFSEGPLLPTKYTRRGFFYALPDGHVLLADSECNLWVWDGKKWKKHGTHKQLDRSSESFRLQYGSILAPRWNDGVLLRIDPKTLTIEEVGELYLGQRNPQLFELPDGRLLFLGASLFNNNEAEPELWDPRTKQSNPLPGWEKERERQRKALLTHREKEKKRMG